MIILTIKVSYDEFLSMAHNIFKPYEFSKKFNDDSVIDYWPVTLAYPEGSIKVFCHNVLYIFIPTA